MRKTLFSVVLAAVLFMAAIAVAQYATVGADQVKAMVTGKDKVRLIDVRSLEEYRAGHIPGAINIPAERITAEKGRLPKDKAAPLVFYCRGVG
jgi:rhodanese-related sulfurtransferase